jgi:hypothetical protein
MRPDRPAHHRPRSSNSSFASSKRLRFLP